MAGNLEGGRKAAETNIKRYGSDYYKIIGAKGGKLGTGGGFGQGEVGKKRARIAGAKGGLISRRVKAGHSAIDIRERRHQADLQLAERLKRYVL